MGGDALRSLRWAMLPAVCAVAAILLATRSGWTETLFERGSYLVNTVGACGRCHTPRDAQSKPAAALALAGGFEFDDAVIGHVVGPNITPDRETGSAIGARCRSSRRCATASVRTGRA